MVTTERDQWHAFVQTRPHPGVGAVMELSSSYAQCFERDMPLPITSFGEDGVITLEWNNPTMYLEIECRGSSIAEWFFRDSEKRQTHSASGRSRELLRQIARFDIAL